MKKEDAVKYDGWLYTLDNAIKFLIQQREKGNNIYYEFNGHKLYSADVTFDSAYLEVLGMDYAAYQKKEQEWREEYERKEKEEEEAAQAKIPYWKEEGKKYIPQPLWKEWEKCVEIRAGDLYHGMELDSLLDILKAIDEGKAKTAKDIEEILNTQNHSGASYGIMKSMLKSFSDKYCKLNNLETPTEKMEREQRESEAREREKLEKIEYYKAEGRKYISEELWEEWDKKVDKLMDNPFVEIDLSSFIVIVKEIEKGTFKTKEDVIRGIDEEDNRYGTVEATIRKYSKAFALLPNENENE